MISPFLTPFCQSIAFSGLSIQGNTSSGSPDTSIAKFIFIGYSTNYMVAFLRMDINSTINSAESTGARNANIAGPANISGL